MIDRITLTLAHSPDPDDAFMWWALTPDETGSAPMPNGHLRFEASMSDIETLNRLSNEAKYDITAVSCAQYPFIADQYAITSCGGSFGVGYGPKLVSRDTESVHEIASSGCEIAVPGLRTTASLVAAMLLQCNLARLVSVPFDEVIDRVASGEFKAGVVIHEGQLTFRGAGLVLACDLGAWWHAKHELPLPLGLNVIRRDIDLRFGRGTTKYALSLLRDSIDYALSHRGEAVEYAMRFARGVSVDEADAFIRMYVNDHTLHGGSVGRRAVEALLAEGAETGLVPAVGEVTVLDCA